MKRTVRGAATTVAAGAILVAGGTMAHGDMLAGAADTGASLTRTGCTGWTLAGGSVRTPTMVPGDVLTRRCSFEVEVPDGLPAVVTGTRPGWRRGGDLARRLRAEAVYAVNGEPAHGPVTVADGDQVTVVLRVAYPARWRGRGIPTSSARLDDVGVTLALG